MTGQINQTLRKAQSLGRKGALSEARQLYQNVLQDFPNNKRAREGLAKLDRGQGSKAALGQVLADYAAGRHQDAANGAVALLAARPKERGLWKVLGAALGQMGDAAGAVKAFEQVCQIAPDEAEGFINLASAYRQAGAPNAAIKALQEAVRLEPGQAGLQADLGTLLLNEGRAAEAVTPLKLASAMLSERADVAANLGKALKDNGELDASLVVYQCAASINPDDAGIQTNIGNLLSEMEAIDGAFAAYDRALQLDPDNPLPLYNLGKLYYARGRWAKAIEAYSAAVKGAPDNAQMHNSLGNAYKKEDQLAPAKASYQRAIELQSDYADAESNLGVVLMREGDQPAAIAAFARAWTLQPEFHWAEAQMRHLRQQICDWHHRAADDAACAYLGLTNAVAPFTMIASEDNPARQLIRARREAAEKFTARPAPLPARPKARPERLRLGYFSADFRNHPVMQLISGLLREHDRKAFDVFAFSYGTKADQVSTTLRDQAQRDVDQFIDVTELNDEEIATRAREAEIDVAIDLTGYTQNSRSGAFQHRLAGVQINYLGYPSTMGTDFMDYMIADPMVIPPEQRAHYAENIIYLPQSFQPNDNLRQPEPPVPSRTELGLPEDAVVLASFNNSYKVSPAEYDIWMQVLRDVPEAVLWLAAPTQWARENLRAETLVRGVDPTRIIFAGRVPAYVDHMARLRQADLFLDTFNYNAHTTASDALWAGLPIVTKLGAQFAARVAGSLLTTHGLPELVTQSREDYASLITALARDPGRLKELRQKVTANIPASPLFDTQRYTRDFEAGLNAAYDRYFAGQSLADIWIPDTPTAQEQS